MKQQEREGFMRTFFEKTLDTVFASIKNFDMQISFRNKVALRFSMSPSKNEMENLIKQLQFIYEDMPDETVNLSEEIQKIFNDGLDKINAAYDEIKKFHEEIK